MLRPQEMLEGVPGWLQTTITLAVGAGGARLLAVWLENRRLANREYRDTMLARIRELEDRVDRLMREEGDLRVKVAHLEEHNAKLRWKVENGQQCHEEGAEE